MDEEIRVMVARIDERTKYIKEAQEKHIENTSAVLKDHEKRIRQNTRFRVTLIGWVAGAGGLGALFGKVSDKIWPF